MQADPMPSATQLDLAVLPQPDGTTCGPTCLHALYGYFGDPVPLEQIIEEIQPLPGGGTLAVSLACHALKRGYAAQIYTYNLQVFDPTWFDDPNKFMQRLRLQSRLKRRKKLSLATIAYLEFLELGGRLRFEDLTRDLIRRTLNRNQPILTGLSATYLYSCAREYRDEYDDTRGEPVGHFVVLSGYDTAKRSVMIADPMQNNPLNRSHYYSVGIDRLLGAILLGILTYDANLLVISPARKRRRKNS